MQEENKNNYSSENNNSEEVEKNEKEISQSLNTNTGEDKKEENKVQKNIAMAVIAYILFFIPLLTDAKNDQFVKFHVKQGLVLFLTSLVISIIGQISFAIFSILQLGILVLFVIGIINALNGKEEELPVVGKFAKEFKF